MLAPVINTHPKHLPPEKIQKNMKIKLNLCVKE